MKKTIIVLAVLFYTIVLTSCTDETIEFEENLAFKANLELIDKDEIENPRDR